MVKTQRGDTIIEVLLALTLLSAVLFSSWAIVNRATQINAAARQRVVLVNQVKEQAEILKSIYANNRTEIANRKFGGTATINFASGANEVDVNPCVNTESGGVVNGTNPTNSFYFNASAAPVTGTKVVDNYENAKIWMQMKSGSGYIDFYIRGCWLTNGGQQNDDNTQVIVRLNV